MNGVLIDEVPKFLAPVPHETMHAIQLENPFDATHPITISLQLNGVISYFKIRKPTQEEYEDQNILKIELTVEAPLWDLSNPDYSHQEQSTFDYRGLSTLSHYATDVMDNDNYTMVMESFHSA